MTLSEFSNTVLPAVENEMKNVISASKLSNDNSLWEILTYHFGWDEDGNPTGKPGKRIRPLLLLLSSEASGGKWQDAIPAAAAVELLHNFSLIHDDIEDKSDFRRGRKTVWKFYNLPLALNAGDSLYSLSFLAMHRLAKSNNAKTLIQALEIFTQSCLSLTKGQHLDISFEDKNSVTIEQYLEMIVGKTATLLSSSAHLGSLIAGADPEIQKTYQQLGLNLGLAFQIYDDLLGIWGDPNKTGKSAASDLISRKKTLPILYGLQRRGEFAKLWDQAITEQEVTALADLLHREGGYSFGKKQAEYYTDLALQSFKSTKAKGNAASDLEELIHMLIDRDV